MTAMLDLDYVRQLDADDPLSHMRARFLLPDDLVYLDGNSLGVLPAGTSGRVMETVEKEWGHGLIGSWSRCDWIGAPQRVGGMIAPLIGAAAHEVIATDSTSVNLFKLITAACAARPERNIVLCEPGNFPTDLYIAGGVTSVMPGRQLRIVPVDDIIDAIDENVAVVVLTHVHYKTGRKLNMAAITAAAHAKGALIIWDLCHSAGAVEVDLNGCEADLAVGCGYKYLNGGPGAPAFLFVAERLQSTLESPLTGWMGHRAPFSFVDEYIPASGIDRFLCGTPSILGLSALEQALIIFREVEFTNIIRKSAALSSLFIDMFERRLLGFGFELITPRMSSERGSHVSIVHEHAYPICQALIASNVVGDFRAPDALRIGFTPLYTKYEDIWRAVEVLRNVMTERSWDREEYHIRGKVT